MVIHNTRGGAIAWTGKPNQPVRRLRRPGQPRRQSSIRAATAKSAARSMTYFERTPTVTKDKGVTFPIWLLPVSLVCLGLMLLTWTLTAAPWLRVRDIIIEGQPTDETKAEIEKLRGQNILWLSVTRPESAIVKQQPDIKHIQILRGIPDTLRINLIERKPAMIWQSGDKWYTLDPSGFIFKAQELPKKEDGSFNFPGTDLPVVVDTKNVPTEIGKTVARSQFVTFVDQLRERLPKEFQLRLIRAEVGETTFNVTAVTDAGWSILFDTTRSLDVQLRTLTKVLESKRSDIHQYVDIRVRGWVYYK